MKHRPHWRQASALPGTGAITVGEGGELHRCPGCLAPLGRYSRGLTRMSLAFFVMASSSPSCKIRQLLVHVGSRRSRGLAKGVVVPARHAHSHWASLGKL